MVSAAVFSYTSCVRQTTRPACDYPASQLVSHIRQREKSVRTLTSNANNKTKLIGASAQARTTVTDSSHSSWMTWQEVHVLYTPRTATARSVPAARLECRLNSYETWISQIILRW